MIRRNGVVVLLLIAFTATALFGLAVSFMNMDEEMGATAHCPFMNGHVSICPMSAFEHVSAWQIMFAAILPLIASAFVARLFVRTAVVTEQYYEQAPPGRRQRSPFIIVLTREFSSGILHPKLYA